MHIRNPIFLFLVLSSLIATSLGGNNDPDLLKESLFTVLANQEYSEVTLKLDMKRLQIQKKQQQEDEQETSITFQSAKGETIQLPVKISPRGRYRRQFCDFPPLKLNFPKRKLRAKGLAGKFDKYKLVTHCMESDDSEQALLREYAVYKMYNELTTESFKVHLIYITYQDVKDKDYQIKQVAFIIEDNEEMASRLGGKLIDKFGLSTDKFTTASFNNTMVFNYMIGNLDWSIRRHKNMKFVKIRDKKSLVAVPYDFDLCGIVMPEYARLNPNFDQKNLKDRFCIGKFDNEAIMLETISRFEQLKNQFIKCYKDISLLKPKYKKKMTNYLVSFYGFLGEDDELPAVFLAGKYVP